MNLKSLALQRAHQFRSLVCGNSAGDANRDPHASIVAGFALENRERITSPPHGGIARRSIDADRCAVADPVAAAALGVVESQVGSLDQYLRLLSKLRDDGCAPDADGDDSRSIGAVR